MKVAAINSWSEPLQISQNIERMEGLLIQLRKKQVRYALFPELGVSGYLNSQHLLKSYESLHLDALQSVKSLSANFSEMYISLGLPMPQKGGWAIAQLTLLGGEIVGEHYKTHLSVHELKNYIPGNQLELTAVDTFNLGLHLCLESHYPELSLMYQDQGAELLAYAFASPRETPNEKTERFAMLLKTRAYDNCCFVMACNQTGKTPSGKNYAGASLIISPRGKIVSQSNGWESNYCVAEIDRKDILRIKHSRMSHFPTYRNTVFELKF